MHLSKFTTAGFEGFVAEELSESALGAGFAVDCCGRGVTVMNKGECKRELLGIHGLWGSLSV